MENLKCQHCNTFIAISSRSLSSHIYQCTDNPLSKKKSEAWRKSMSSRRGLSINGWKNVDWDSIPFHELSSRKQRERLLAECNYSCTMCGFNKVRADGGVILEIDHIDGDHGNNSSENLRVLCPNCHALTPNFRNWGRDSRQKTSKRFRKGNKDFIDKHAVRLKEDEQLKQCYESSLRTLIQQLHDNGTVDFSKRGWVKEVSSITGERYQRIAERVRRVMPDFYDSLCFKRSNHLKRLQENIDVLESNQCQGS
jgi:hypothetical protein